MIFGVSHGNGNDGVSQLHPDFYVELADKDQAFDLAFAAMVDQFDRSYMTRYAKLIRLDGESEYTVSATIDDPIGSRGYSEHNGCWRICEVFPVAEEDVRDGLPSYDSLADAVTASALLRAKRYAH